MLTPAMLKTEKPTPAAIVIKIICTQSCHTTAWRPPQPLPNHNSHYPASIKSRISKEGRSMNRQKDPNWYFANFREGSACPFCIVGNRTYSKKGFFRHIQTCPHAMSAMDQRSIPAFAGPTTQPRVGEPTTGRDSSSGRSLRKRNRQEEEEDATVWSMGETSEDEGRLDGETMNGGVANLWNAEIDRQLHPCFEVEEVRVQPH
jgi:hypothetical protein